MRYAVALFLALSSVGCHKGCIDAEATNDAVQIVLDRHDRLLTANPPRREDGSVDTAKLESELRTSDMLRVVYAEAQKPVKTE
jgi:hypothetical protein